MSDQLIVQGIEMDIEEALDRARDAVSETFWSHGNADYAYDLAYLFEAIDEWLQKGGILPKDWQR